MTQAEQIVVGIVHSIFGNVPVISAEMVVEAARRLAVPPNGETGRALALFCQQFLNAHKNLNYDLATNGERWLLSRMAAFRPAVVFDVGANVGNWLAAARTALPETSIHAFEIIPATSAQLAQRMAGEPKVIVNRFGLSDRSGTVTMRAFDASTEFASHAAYPHGSYRELDCPVRQGDEYLRENQIDRIDLLKIDVEGAEHLVMKGFGHALAGERIDVIQFEYGKVNILTHFLLKDFYDLLDAHGYALGKLFPDYVDFRPYVLADEDFLGPNYVAVRRARADLIDALRKQ